MKFILSSITFSLIAFTTLAQDLPELMEMEPAMTEIWEPEVKSIAPGEKYGDVPSDAIVLFDGSNLDEWTNDSVGEAHWSVENGTVTASRMSEGLTGNSGIRTKRQFGSVQMHIEWLIQTDDTGTNQKPGNSGVIFSDGRYEVQILESYYNRTYRDGQAASLYKQSAPLVNASKKPGEWQSYDIIFMQPHFKKDGSYLVPPKITVLHNGILVQNAVELRGPTVYIGMPEYQIEKHGPGSISLQYHGNPVNYRNIWVREL